MGETFSVGGVVAGIRETTPADALHPALMLVVDVGGEYCRIAVPRAVWPAGRELLQIGQRIAVSGLTDSFPFLHGSRQVAEVVHLAGVYH